MFRSGGRLRRAGNTGTERYIRSLASERPERGHESRGNRVLPEGSLHKSARPEAWLGLLEEGYLDDGLLTGAESRELRSFLLGTDRDGRTRELLFRENKKGYGLFAYEAGIAYFYKFEETENKKSAKAYLKAAAESGGLSEQQRRRAKRLLAIAEYYGKIGVADEAGDDYVDSRGLLERSAGATAGNLVEEDNARTALVLYGGAGGADSGPGNRISESGSHRTGAAGLPDRTAASSEERFRGASGVQAASFTKKWKNLEM